MPALAAAEASTEGSGAGSVTTASVAKPVASAVISGVGAFWLHPASSNTLPESAVTSMVLVAAMVRMSIEIPFSLWEPLTWTSDRFGSTCRRLPA